MSESKNEHIFSIEALENPTTKRPFGQRFKGDFHVRRPTISDLKEIAVKDAALLNIYGRVDTDQVGATVANNNYIFTMLSVIAKESPDWFDQTALYEEDQAAISCVYGEVADWLNTFRPQTDSGASIEGEQKP